MAATLTPSEVSAANAPADPTQPASNQNKRRQGRTEYSSEHLVFLMTPALLQIVRVATREISPGGISFVSPFPFAVDQEFILTLPRPDGMTALLCRVRHAAAHADQGTIAGASFEHVYKDNALRSAILPEWVRLVETIIGPPARPANGRTKAPCGRKLPR